MQRGRHAGNREQVGSARLLRAACMLLALALSTSMPASAGSQAASALRALHAQSAERLQDAPYDRPLWIESRESGGRLHGDLHARVEHPFARVEATLGEPSHWCGLLTLLPNIRRCEVAEDGSRLAVRIARRFDQPLDDTYEVDFTLRKERIAGEYLQATLEAEKGPVGTSQYRILLRAVPVSDAQSFVHVHYGYSYGLTARVGAQAYLATRGRNKLGFSVARIGEAGQPELIGGLRGAVERNAMRTYLAIDAYLAAHDLPPAERRERSLQAWLEAIEDYPRQLAEADREAYYEAKRRLP
jgi:hypothetical protein